MREYPNTICDVVHQAEYRENWKGNMIPVKHRCQFSYFCDGKPEIIEDSKTWNESYMLATLLVNGMYDFTHGASHYHNDLVYPYWADHLKHTVTIDNHIFYKQFYPTWRLPEEIKCQMIYYNPQQSQVVILPQLL